MEHNSDQAFSYQNDQDPAPAVPNHASRTVSRNVAYIFSTIALLTAATSLTIILTTWVNGSFTKNGVSFDVIAFPAAALIVALPVFTTLLMDLERAEQKNPRLKSSPYKRYSAQFAKVVAFITCFFTLIGLVFGIFLHASASSDGNWLPRLFVDSLIILAVAGGVLAYSAMNDRHKP